MKTRKVTLGLSLSLLVALAWLAAVASPASASLIRTGGWDGGDFARPFELSSVAVDDDGNAYVGDFGLTRIVKVGSDGVADFNWGVGEPGQSFPPNPVDLTVDGDGNVYALDMEGKKVRKYSPDGDLLTSWPVSSGYFGGRWSIAWESGKVWVLAETKVFGFEPDGTPVSLDDDAFQFDSIPNYVSPQIAGDGDGHLVVASAAWIAVGNAATKSIYRFDTDGTQLSKWTAAAKIQVGNLPAGGSYIYVYGYANLAVDPAGNIWISDSDADYPFKKIDASGLLPGGVGGSLSGTGLEIDDQGHFWTLGSDPDHSADSQLRRTDSDGSGLVTWGRDDFPDYAEEVWPASFDRISDYSVDSNGNVAILDLGFHRVKIFNAAGEFQRGFKIPEGIGSDLEYVARVYLGDDGTVEVFDGVDGKLRRYDNSGALTGESGLDVPGRVKDFTRTANGGHLVISRSGSVTSFDSDDQETGSWNLKPHQAGIGSVKGIVQGTGGDVYVLTPDYLDRYSAAGERLGTWSLRDEECAEEWSDGFVDLAVDGDGNVYATASLGTWVNWTKLYAFDPELKLLWSDNMDYWEWGGSVEAAPDGSFLSTGGGINRLEHVGPDDPGLVTTCRREPGKFKLLGIKYGPGHAWANLRVHVPEAGKLGLSGSKVVGGVKKVSAAGNYAITVKARPKLLKPARPRRQARLKVRLAFKGESGTSRRNVTVLLKGKLAGRTSRRR